jgi:hypothetical protein
MRAYRKSRTAHDFCVYLTPAEVRELVIEAQIAAEHSTDVPELERLRSKLEMLLSDSGRKQA